MPQSDLLTAFYRAYLNWIMAGAPNFRPFNRRSGLCENLKRFIKDNHLDRATIWRIEEELYMQFQAARLKVDFPFNSGRRHYLLEAKEARMQENPLRLQWVLDHAQLGQPLTLDDLRKRTQATPERIYRF